jgi:hypothetical protein
MLINHKNNRFQKKLIGQNIELATPLSQAFSFSQGPRKHLNGGVGAQ